jgi:hypothetical protein
MLPLFSPPDDGQPWDARKRARALTGGVVGLLVALGLVLMIMLTGRSSATMVMPAVVAITIVVIGGALILKMLSTNAAQDKGKRGLEGMDIYSLINRLVDDVDEEELAYLERKIDERKRHPDRTLTEDIGDLLDQRDQDRRTGLRE